MTFICLHLSWCLTFPQFYNLFTIFFATKQHLQSDIPLRADLIHGFELFMEEFLKIPSEKMNVKNTQPAEKLQDMTFPAETGSCHRPTFDQASRKRPRS